MMTNFWLLGALWFALALLADFLSIRLKIAVALTEIFVGVGAAYGLSQFLPSLGSGEQWIQFLAGVGAVMLTFLAGSELDPDAIRGKWGQVLLIGLIGFFAPFVGCTAVAFYYLHWTFSASLLAGVALSTTSVAVVYAVMLELGLNATKFGKIVLAACFVNDLGTVLALGFIFAPFSIKTAIFAGASLVILVLLPFLSSFLFKRWGNRHSELESKYLLFFLLGLGYLAFWSGSEPVLPAYLVGMILSKVLTRTPNLIRRIRALTFGLLTPFYFLRAGSLVSLPDLWIAPTIFLVLFGAKMITKILGVYPATLLSRYPQKEAIYTTLLMSTGLTFGTISALYGLSHGIITQSQYSALVAAVIASAIIPTLIANAFFLPHHILPNRFLAPELPIRK